MLDVSRIVHRRRALLRTVGVFLVLAIAPSARAQASEVRACWLTQYAYTALNEAGLRALAQNVRAGGMNTIYFNVYGGGGVTFWPSRAFQAAGGSWASPSLDWTRYLIRIFHEEGLQVGAWFEYGLALSSIVHPVAVAHPDWLARDSSGSAVTGENGGFVFLSPGHSGATAMIVGMVRELARDYDFDDIQVDRIRWGRKSTGREYGYEASTSALYQSQFGSLPPSNVNNAQWVAFREGLVDALMQQCYVAIKAAHGGIVVSAAPTGSYGWTQHMQRWNHWTAGGYIDLVMPQMYMTSLASFQSEFDSQKAAAGSALSKLGVGYRAQDAADWTLVRDQLNYARSGGVDHGTLWVYHYYTSVPAIQDEIDNLPDPGQPWQADAINPFVDEECIQVFVDNADPLTTATQYVETGAGWIDSAQPDFFEFNSRVAPGGALATAEFRAALPRAGSYDVYEWHTASSNRNDAAELAIDHAFGTSTVNVDQRTAGGAWNLVGRFYFEDGALTRRAAVSTANSSAIEFTSADALRLVYRDDVLAYCTAKTNSLGCVPQIAASGTPTASGVDDFHVRALDVLNNKNGIFFWGLAPKSAPFMGGTMCVLSPVRRTPAHGSGGSPSGDDCSGVYDFHFTHAYLTAHGLAPGTAVYGQFWSRDPSHPDGSTVGLSGGVVFAVQP
jgi:uncharacterized lipoprotein YddW (UPF0748 family)